MKYFVINIQTTAEGTVQSIFAYDSYESAVSTYHSTLASNYASDVLLAFSVVLMDEHGQTEKWETYDPRTPEE